MLVFKAVKPLQKQLDRLRQEGRRIGLVPTMGALHEGHCSLMREALKSCDVCVVSVFVNPRQFNDPADLERYPRSVGPDLMLLAENGIEVVFMPLIEEVYPPGLELPQMPPLGYLGDIMEGSHRPGHFQGMREVVYRLLDVVRPEVLYMGQKDYQQAVIVRHLIRELRLSVRLEVCPTIRDERGLALSSRNQLLSPAWNLIAPSLYQALVWAGSQLGEMPVREIESKASDMLRENELKPDYFVLADGETLLPVEDAARHQHIVVLVAAVAGKVRLIDNLTVRKP
jgi:pantoate--beta-alanine ligase